MDIYDHPTIKNLSKNKKEKIWFAYREKYPNWKWGFSFFIAWFLWASFWMVCAQWIGIHYLSNFFSKITVHLLISFILGVIGGVVFIGYFLLPLRKKHFFEYLNQKSISEVLKDLVIDEVY